MTLSEPEEVLERVSDTEPENCIICLQPITDNVVLPACGHRGCCFQCMLLWIATSSTVASGHGKSSRRCPLCNTPIGNHIIHGIRGQYDFERHWLAPPSSPTARPSTSNETHADNASVRTGQIGPRRGITRVDRRQQVVDELERAIERRRHIYRHGMFVKHIASNRHTQYKPTLTPSRFAASPDLISRATKFIRRELRVWNGLDVEFLTRYLLSILCSIDIRTDSAVRLISEFLDDGAWIPGPWGEEPGASSSSGIELGNRTYAEHFAHELYAYLRSPCIDIAEWDRLIQYDEPQLYFSESGSNAARHVSPPRGAHNDAIRTVPRRLTPERRSDRRRSGHQRSVEWDERIKVTRAPREGTPPSAPDRDLAHRDLLNADTSSKPGVATDSNPPEQSEHSGFSGPPENSFRIGQGSTIHPVTIDTIAPLSRAEGTQWSASLHYEPSSSVDAQAKDPSRQDLIDLDGREELKIRGYASRKFAGNPDGVDSLMGTDQLDGSVYVKPTLNRNTPQAIMVKTRARLALLKDGVSFTESSNSPSDFQSEPESSTPLEGSTSLRQGISLLSPDQGTMGRLPNSIGSRVASFDDSPKSQILDTGSGKEDMTSFPDHEREKALRRRAVLQSRLMREKRAIQNRMP